MRPFLYHWFFLSYHFLRPIFTLLSFHHSPLRKWMRSNRNDYTAVTFFLFLVEAKCVYKKLRTKIQTSKSITLMVDFTSNAFRSWCISPICFFVRCGFTKHFTHKGDSNQLFNDMDFLFWCSIKTFISCIRRFEQEKTQNYSYAKAEFVVWLPHNNPKSIDDNIQIKSSIYSCFWLNNNIKCSHNVY